MRFRSILFFVVIMAVMSACGSKTPPATSAAVPTDTLVPTPGLSPTPTIPLAVLILPADLEADTSNQYQTTVYDLAQQAGMRFQVRNEFTAADLEPGLQIVIAVSNDPGIAALAAAATQVQFLAVDIPDITPGGNISVLGRNAQNDLAGFLAGYTAALITEDYRIGMMMPKDNADAIASLNAFANGMKFYCGTCRPLYLFPWTYPQYVEIPAEEDKANYHAWADVLMLQYKVNTIFIYPDVYTEDLATYIGTTGVSMIGTVKPEQRPAGWVMTIQPDLIKGIQNAWPQLISGQGGTTFQSPIGIADVDPDLLSAGRQRDVEKVLSELQAGRINIQSVP